MKKGIEEMREIKFRAWDKKLKLMYATDSVSLCIDGEICYLDTDGEWVADMANRITLMQYTGLKDKNGEKIYEGDVVLDRWANTYTPIFQNGIYMAYNPKYLSLKNEPSTQFNVIWRDGCEVIGNIYENPEMLEV